MNIRQALSETQSVDGTELRIYGNDAFAYSHFATTYVGAQQGFQEGVHGTHCCIADYGSKNGLLMN